ncbi:hypothetical protein [Nonomuraea typhae]|uniref:deoxynucleotide monophosphate kinase family protein n=1 Tax=Nonomuraea typhae TaxID=2603600 RepID=UPI0012FAD83B|nr:hypothetical protein [Nonomuraea typhae]
MKLIIGLHGFAQSGKDTFADALVRNYDFRKVAFADPVRELLAEQNPVALFEDGHPVRLRELVDRFGWDEAKQIYPPVRELLQSTGMSVRQVLGARTWIDEAFRRAEGADRVVFSDVRMTNEAALLRDLYGATLVKVERPGVGPVNDHISDAGLPEPLFDWRITNSSTIADLIAQADMLIHRLTIRRTR